MKGKEGFTLVEVMIAMVVLLLGMLGVMAMQYFAVSGNTASRELRTGTNLSAEILEEMKGTPYTSLRSNTDTVPITQALTGGMRDVSGGTVSIPRAWWVVPNCISLKDDNGNACTAIPAPSCANTPDAVVSPVSAIRARTCWTDADGRTHSVELDTLRWDENVIP